MGTAAGFRKRKGRRAREREREGEREREREREREGERGREILEGEAERDPQKRARVERDEKTTTKNKGTTFPQNLLKLLLWRENQETEKRAAVSRAPLAVSVFFGREVK